MPQPYDAELDAALNLWAGHRRLTEEQAEAVRGAVVDAVDRQPSPEWWRDFTAHITATIVQANAAARTPVSVGVFTRGRGAAARAPS